MKNRKFVKNIAIFAIFYNIFFILIHLIFSLFSNYSIFNFDFLIRIIINIPISIILGYILIPFFLKKVKQKVYLNIDEKDIISVMQNANFVLSKKDMNKYVFKSKNPIKSINYFGKVDVTIEKQDSHIVLYGIESIITPIANRFEKHKSS